MAHHDTHPSILRPARPSDVGAIVEIERVSFVHAGERFGARHVKYLVGSARASVVVAEVEKRALGWIAGFTWLRGKVPWGRVYAIAVHPDARGRGLGPLLMQRMIEHCEQAGAVRIFLEVRPDNAGAIRLYEKCGFAACATLDHYYGARLPALRMVRG